MSKEFKHIRAGEKLACELTVAHSDGWEFCELQPLPSQYVLLQRDMPAGETANNQQLADELQREVTLGGSA